MKKKFLLPLALVFAAGIAWAADTITTHYSLVQPQVGASANTWGSKINSDLASIDSLIWSASGGTTIGVDIQSSASNITLTNPVNNVQNITLSTTGKSLILPAMNSASSLVIGGTLYVHNSGSNSFNITANDGTTVLVTALAAGGNAYLTLLTNGTVNGTFNTVTPAPVSGTVLPVASGGTGTGTAFTQGSVVLAGSSGVYTQDNANFFWDATNHRLGIGTTTPAVALAVTGDETIGATLNVTGTTTLTGALVSGLTASELVATDGSKNLASVTALPSGTTATTQVGTDSSTKVATTAQVQAALIASTLTAKAWCTFDGTVTGTHACVAGSGITSVTRNAMGDYSVLLATTQANINYSYVIQLSTGGTTAQLYSLANSNAAGAGVNPTTTVFRFSTYVSGGGSSDFSTIYVQVFGT